MMMQPALRPVPIGIDLGTTQCAVACLDEHGRPRLLPNAHGALLTPSVIQARPDGTCLIGAEAKAEIVLAKADTAAFFKRDMGTEARYVYGGREWTPVTLSAALLAQLKADAEAALGRPVAQAVITVPAYFQDAARQATFEAGRLAGLEVLQVLNEPTAAAIAYAASQGSAAGPLRRALVYDLGGGTFDVSVVEFAGAQLSVLASDGNHTLGGKDWDDRLLRYVAAEFEARHGSDPLDDPHAYQEMAVRVEEAKIALSLRERAAIVVAAHGELARIEVERSMFEALTSDLLQQTEVLTRQVLQAVELDAAALDAVVLAGGSTRLPTVPALLGRLWGRAPVQTVSPDACVALGAALYAGQLGAPAAGKGLALRLRDAISHSLGMVAVSADGERYVNSRLIPKHHAIPASVSRPFAVPARAESVAVYVTQGESESPFEVEFVGKYAITGFSEGGAANEIEIRYAYDESGRVEVKASERGSGRELTIEKQPLPEDMGWLAQGPQALRARPKTVYLVIDLSGSMAGEPLAEAQEAMRKFVANSSLDNTAIGVMVVADRAQVVQAATQDAKALERAIRSLAIGQVGFGNGADPFTELSAAMASAESDKFAVVLADGVWGYQERAIRRARSCHAEGIQIAAIGFGAADEEFLRKIASCHEAALFTQDLSRAFEHIARELSAGRGLVQQR